MHHSMAIHTIRPGDCIRSLSHKHGISPERIWNHGDNAALREVRGDPHLLAKGDRVSVPDKEAREESAETGQKHTFRRQIGSTKLVLRLIDEEQPLADTPYTLDVGGAHFDGTTDGDGRLEEVIPGDARQGTLQLEHQDPISLEIGGLDPVDTITGIQQRLSNLGFPCGAVDGIEGKRTTAAATAWQREHDLEVDGVVGAQTPSSLEDEYGC